MALLLEQSSANYEELLSSLKDNAVVITDTQGDITWFNQSFSNLTGYSLEEAKGKTPGALLQGPESSSETIAYISAQLRHASGFNAELLNYKKNGEKYWVSIEAQPIHSKEDTLLGFIAIERDITEQKQLTESLQRQNALLDSIRHAQEMFISDLGPRAVFNQYLPDLLKLTESEYGFIGEVLYSEDGKPYLKTWSITNIAWNDETLAFYNTHNANGLEFKNLNTLFGLVMTSGKYVISNDPYTDSRRGGLPSGHPKMNSFMGVPFFLAGKMIGMIGIANRPNGYTEEVIHYIEPLLASLAGIIQAVRTKQQAAKVKADLLRAQHALDNTMEMILTLSPDSKQFTYANRGTKDVLGIESDITNFQLSDFLDEKDDEHLASILKNICEDKSVARIELQLFPHKAGAAGFPAELSVQWVETESAPAIVIMARNIEEQKKIDRLKMEFVSAVSHELRTPLTSIKGSLGLLQSPIAHDVPPFAKELIDMAYKNANQLSTLVNDILDINKLELGHMSFSIDTYSAGEILRESLMSNEGFATEFGVEICCNDALSDNQIHVDKTRLIQVLSNLLSNAIKFSPVGTQVFVRQKTTPHQLRIEVEDSGPGIPDSFKDRIFQKFSHANFSDAREYAGSGLGLFISKTIIERLGGKIGFFNNQTTGSTFFVELPLCKQD